MYSDNGTTFIAAPKPIMQETGIHVNRKLIPRKSLWQRGFTGKNDCFNENTWEKIVNKVTLRTSPSEVEAVINDRPLTNIPSNINNPTPITPLLLLDERRNAPCIGFGMVRKIPKT